jgi:ABC-type multidrug transport system ATPase subunit
MNLLQELIPFPERVMLKKRLQKGITILVSAYMDEAALCDRIALIQKGLF